MSNHAAEIVRDSSDRELLAGGSSLLPDGRLVLTGDLVVEKRSEMMGALNSLSIEKAQKIIGAMDNEAFGTFANELQFAMKYYDIGYQVANTSMFWNEGEHQSPAAIKAAVHNIDLRNEIIRSPLYDAIRKGIQTRWHQEVRNEWTGWIGLDSPADIKKIDDAIRVILKEQMPIVGMIMTGVRPAEIEEANKTIFGYGIQRVFITDPAKPLLTVFHEHWGKQ